MSDCGKQLREGVVDDGAKERDHRETPKPSL